MDNEKAAALFKIHNGAEVSEEKVQEEILPGCPDCADTIRKLWEDREIFRKDAKFHASRALDFETLAEENRRLLTEKLALETAIVDSRNAVAERDQKIARIESLREKEIKEIEESGALQRRFQGLQTELGQVRDAASQLEAKSKQDSQKLAEMESALEIGNKAVTENAALKAELGRVREEASRLSKRNLELEDRYSFWENTESFEIKEFEAILDRAETGVVSPPFKRLAEVMRGEYSNLTKLQSRFRSGASFSALDFAVAFDPYRPLGMVDVEADEIIPTAQLIMGLEKVRRFVLGVLSEQGFEPIRPIPQVNKYDPILHDDLPSLRRSTPRIELTDMVSQRVDVGVMQIEPSGRKLILKRAQVGRYVYSPR